ncbi:MAG: Zn-dependent hydrolase [Proteobacteria bacterium]|nr:Zn-dependent hydrolase [Pseudomonadota bacterium]
MQPLKVDGERLWQSLMDLARIGATPKGGVRRLTLTDLDRQGRDTFVQWARAAGMTIRIDAIGNIFARRAGVDDSLPPVMTGSHLDTQPSGGKFDGAYGVMAGLEVVRRLNDLGIRTRAPIEVAAWTNEEGSRFVPTMMGSGVYASVYAVGEMLAQKDVDGVSVGEALKSIGYQGDAKPVKVGAYFEAHIEQGPVLENTGTTIGAVQGALGQRWFDVEVTGQDSHAGPTPMELRRDALLAASRLVVETNRVACTYPDNARATVGHMRVAPNSRNVVPGAVNMTLDVRNAKDETLLAMVEDLRRSAAKIAAETRCTIDVKEVLYFAPSHFDPKLVESVRASARALGLSCRDIVSGAAHDAVYLNRIAPTAMIFVPCEGGLSHNELENARPDEIAAGASVLINAMVAAAVVAEAAQAA